LQVGISERQVFALKKLHKGIAEVNGFQNELMQLRRFNGKDHPHIVTLLASFEHNGASHFIFPWAESTLEDYWEQKNPYDDKPPPSSHLDLDHAIWVAKQLEGMTGAVASIHGPRPHHLAPNTEGFGRHSDLKPDNILWFKHDKDPKGILIVTDLGLATFNREVSRSIEPGSSARVPGYRAPECDMEDGRAKRLTDIWTLGCIYLEFMTWLLGGFELLKKFEEARKSVDHLNQVKGKLFFEFVDQPNPEVNQGRVGQMQVKKTVSDVRFSPKPQLMFMITLANMTGPFSSLPACMSERTALSLLMRFSTSLSERCCWWNNICGWTRRNCWRDLKV
jgi:serine/threonine protein kinase